MYPSPLAVSSRKLTDNVVLSATGFKMKNRVNFGARMALFRFGDSGGLEVNKALELLTGQTTDFNVTHLIVPNSEHTMAVASFKKAFPMLKIIAMESVQLGKGVSPDYVMTSKYGNKKLGAEALREIGVQEPEILENFEFVYLPSNKELVTYHKESKAVFEADILFNLRSDVPMEQFSPATGFPKNYHPFSGMSFPARFLNADSKMGRFLPRKMVNAKASAKGLQAINAWNFDTIVMCHGNVMEKGGKAAFKKVYLSVLN
ncbi:hypothetical protein METBIDRAFT_79170 [Metschnikowia bicuspidata var. bicuspidata NRRL YB-4993]|uniref:Uncharacterized protein n=1 Tax=Metschnikowia bicuspidata var. bicuspidata NRRL YB-4993 TaxID=869754 RepID=A0A1A0H762_9ASCO|nr:hypothetical protein METBIDRAFT_79170 [Metschnikowia bicuspidata var. bicuspidata NRRL YB-4993]OBA19815.1 hypothetical protein METBIDRAFT_79170 [Metschnikowia bicuspidata var. bicuspidata NRRL YB-4993]